MKPHPDTPCDDPDCDSCQWKLAGDLKAVFRRYDGAWDDFCDYIWGRGISRQVRWVNGNIYVHRTLDTAELGDWLPTMHYL